MTIDITNAALITLLLTNLYFVYLLAKRNSKAMEQHAHLIDRIRDIIKTDITDIQVLKIIEAVTAFNHRPNDAPPKATIVNDMTKMVNVKTHSTGSEIVSKMSVYDYVTAKHQQLTRASTSTLRIPTLLEVREALENVLNGMVHDELEHDISKDIIQ